MDQSLVVNALVSKSQSAWKSVVHVGRRNLIKWLGLLAIIFTTSSCYPPDYPIELSSNANLLNLTLTVGTLTPAFSADITDYTTTIPYGTITTVMTPILSDPSSSMHIDIDTYSSFLHSGDPVELDFTGGEVKVVTLKITAQDETIKIYTITFNREAPPYLR